MLFQFLDKSTENKILEIGCFEGLSSVFFADNFIDNPNSSLTCVDPFLIINNNDHKIYLQNNEEGNFRHRPIGIGVQGLADAFILMDIPFHSEEAKSVNKLIFETIYHASLEKSNEISFERGEKIKLLDANSIESVLNEYEYSTLNRDNTDLFGAYISFEGSPTSKGILQFDLWNVSPSNRYDWDILKKSIQKYGLRNSLLVAPMPIGLCLKLLFFVFSVG